MFHCYVTASSGTVVDVDRAGFLMDQDLKAECEDWVDRAMKAEPKKKRGDFAQAFWDLYCRRHRETHGRAFQPDTLPGWDQKSK